MPLRVFASVVERDTGSGHEIGNGAGHENFIRARERSDSGRDVNGQACDVITSSFAFPGCAALRGPRDRVDEMRE